MRPRRLLVAFVDALGPQQLEAHGDAFAFAPNRGELRGVLGYSSGAIATLLTGAPPRDHGRMCLFSRASPDAPALAPLAWLGLLPRVLHERGPVRRAIAKLFAAATGNSGYVALHRVPPAAFGWLGLPEQDDIFSADTIGGVPTFLARARAAGLSVAAARWQLPEAERFAAFEADVARNPPSLAFAYAAGLDGALHGEGNTGPRAASVAQSIGSHIERLRDHMSKGADVTTLVVGDHGMADVTRCIDPRAVVDGLAHPRAFVDSTLLRLWGAPASLERAHAAIDRARWPGTWLDTTALDARGAPTASSPYGDAIFVLDEGNIFAPSWVGGAARGMHGYDLGRPSTVAAVASDGPLPASLLRLEDLRPTVEASLKIAV